MIHNEDRFNQLINDALEQDFSGWDFSYLEKRMTGEDVPWNYAEEVQKEMPQADTMLDMGTGGGELLASLVPLPATVCATEGWMPNVPIAKATLEPLGIQVYAVKDNRDLPFEADYFDLIINRHEDFDADEIHRILKPGGIFITQQVGGGDNIRLNKLLSAPLPEFHDWSLETAIQPFDENRFDIIQSEEYFPEERFLDIGAVVYYLKVIEWQVEDFSVTRYRQQLGSIHNSIEENGYLASQSHRFFLKVRKSKS